MAQLDDVTSVHNCGVLKTILPVSSLKYTESAGVIRVLAEFQYNQIVAFSL